VKIAGWASRHCKQSDTSFDDRSMKSCKKVVEYFQSSSVLASGKLGTLKPGAYADLLLIDGDPFKNLGLFQDQGKHLAAIMKGGAFHKNRLN
jgi:hypothetical protein